MRYCKECVMPDKRPGIHIGPGGICSACVGHREKDKIIDWNRRKTIFDKIVIKAKKRKNGYDCIVPVSGGKDSTYQVIKCLEYGLRVLAVTWKSPARSDIGQKNLDNLVRLGVDHIDYTINPRVEKQFMYKALMTKGDTAIPMHMALFSIPLKLAVAYDIPLVVWGESPHMEYGGADEDRDINTLDMKWFKRHSILQGTKASDWVSDELTKKDLEAYYLPPEKEFKKSCIQSVFIGYYFKWDPYENFKIARSKGFMARKDGPKTGYYNYADIDCDFISVHHYFKWLKFGFTRLFDNLSVEIRNGRMSRSQALQIIAERGTERPHEDINKLSSFLDISRDDFHKVEEKFRNKDIWSYKNGKWMIEDFIIKDWEWEG